MSSLELSGATPLPAPDVRSGAIASVQGQTKLPDMWMFVVFECFLFTVYFVFYMLYRNRTPELFLASQRHLSQGSAVVNTLLLLTSSWLVARCVQSARAQRYELATRQLYLTMFFGLLFVASKLSEWSSKLADDLTFSTDMFFSFYYFLTGIHMVHVLIGFGALIVMAYQLHSPARRSQEVIEAGATYWHMVDFLWVLIFALLYLVR